MIQSDGTIIAGHGRYQAATTRLDMDEVPVIILDHLSETQARALVIADNKLAENAGWNMEMLAAELYDLSEEFDDLTITGFDHDELDEMFAGYLEPPEEDAEETEEEIEEEDFGPPINPVSYKGDVWVLGNHRLMCGDCSKSENREKLLGKDKIDMVFTDPPYNINLYETSSRKEPIKRIENDNMPDDQFVLFLQEALIPASVMYVCFSWDVAHLFREAMIGIDRKPKCKIVWNKVNPAQNLDKYFKQYEEIFYYGPYGGEETLRGDIWQQKRQQNTVHPTMKPIELIEIAMDDNPKAKIVFDGFGGSGSTLIACENKKRRCRMFEMDRAYCDVIITRWQKHTGKKAVLEKTNKTFADMKQERANGKEKG